MMKVILTKVILLTLIGASFISCDTKKTSTTSTNDSVFTNPTTGSGNGNGNGNTGGGGTTPAISPDEDVFTNFGQPCVADSGQAFDCYTISGIIGHGTKNQPIGTQIDPIIWDSSTDLVGHPQSALSTDSRLNVRIAVRSRPSQGTTDSKGNLCEVVSSPYTKLSVGVGVLNAAGNNHFSYYKFREIPVDGVSKVYRFSVPQNIAGGQRVVIRDIEWDYGCTFSGSGSGECPMASVWYKDCVKLDLQFSTDTTKDLPGARIN